MKLNYEICSKIGISHSKLIVLKYLIDNFSDELSPFNFNVAQKKLSLSYSSILNALKFLNDINIIEKNFNRSDLKVYIRIIPNKYIEENEVNPMLIDIEDEQSEVCKEADLIAKNILKKYPQYFSHRVVRAGKATNLYKGICHCICDVYNGSFLNSRLYDIKHDSDWRDILKGVRADWVKTRRLIFDCLKNFDLMHKKEYLPYNKMILKTNLKEWFYDDNQFKSAEPTSQFIECIHAPEYVSKHISEQKADEIFAELPVKAQDGGNNLFSLNENMPAGKFWQYVREMVDWARTAYKCDDNMTSWLESPADIVNQFYRYCRENDISVSLNTCNIEKAVECNAPWVWFVQSACDEYGIDNKIALCANLNDFEKYFNLS